MKIEIKVLNAMRFTKLFIAASRWMSKFADVLNDLNVFPTPDGDTGTNISITMQSIENELVKLNHEPNMQELADLISETVLLNATGTSGILMGNIIAGFMSSIKYKEEVTINDVSLAFDAAYKRAYGAIANPLEGTILSVVKTVAIESHNYKGAQDDFILYLNQMKEIASESVKKTTEECHILRENGVVDAGGMAFYYLLEGFEKSVSDPEMLKDLERIIRSQSIRSTRLKKAIVNTKAQKYKYNQEFILAGENINLDEYKSKLLSLGEILYCIQIGDKIRTQINTDNPWDVLKLGDSLGNVYNIKLENIAITPEADTSNTQENADNNPVAETRLATTKIAIVTDSGADIPSELTNNSNLFVIPLENEIDHSNTYSGDSNTSSVMSLYMREIILPRTFAPSPAKFTAFYNEILAKGYTEIISIHIGNNISSTLQAAKVAKNLLPNPEIISIIDSKTLSLPLGHLALTAASMAANDQNRDSIVKNIKELSDKINMFVFAKDMRYLKKRGKFGNISSTIWRILGIVPIFKMENDKFIYFGSKFGKSSVLSFIKDTLTKTAKNNELYVYTIVGNRDYSSWLEKIEKTMVGIKNIEYRGTIHASSTISYYCGPFLGFCCIPKNK